MRDRDYEGRRVYERRTSVRTRALYIGNERRRGVGLSIENKTTWMEPAIAYALADKLVDAAERAENMQRAAAGSSDTA